MQIGILSDSHGRQPALRTATDFLRARAIRTVLHCGDVEDPATVALLEGFEAHFVHGNCDPARSILQAAVAAIGGTYHGDWGSLELAGRSLAFLHGDDDRRLRELVASDAFDYLFHGHTHQARDERIGRTRVLNPGALHRARPRSFLILDLARDAAETIEIERLATIQRKL
jgi:putative phosphoesterase